MFTIDDYIEQHSSAEPTELQIISRQTHLNVLNPHMLSGHVQGRLLGMLSRMIKPHNVLELGTYTGYSALCLAEGTAGKVVTIERNDELEDTIRHNLSLSENGKKVQLVIGDAKQVVPSLTDTFQLVFIDADKREYSAYLDLVLPLIPAGGWIIADNTLWAGHIIDPAYDRDPQTVGLREFNRRVAADDRLQKVILPIRDGLTLIRKDR